MKFIIYLVTFFFFSPLFAQDSKIPVIEDGVSIDLATSRRASLKNIQYELKFIIPEDKDKPIGGQERVSFELLKNNQPLQLDFKQTKDHIISISVNQKRIEIEHKNEHLIISQKYLKLGRNTVEIEFIAGNESLNRNPDYLYALFVPDHARQAFPCFDQPDLKARFKLNLVIPKNWVALSNGKMINKSESETNLSYQFANSDLLPTYLFSFTAGKYKILNKTMGNRNLEFLHRETDTSKLNFSVDSIFIAHHNAIQFLENYTTIPYPFQKFGFVAIPDFQFGGMEHPGEIQYKASSLFLDKGATKDQFISRASLISHETAHMWFGDLVTMKWFNDVWMKEVFANFMADKVAEKMMGKEVFKLKFLQDHYPAAYGVDRTLGANPIRQQLDNLQEAGTMYGNIIYHKAPIMMRQLELLMGAERFQQGVREYLKTYSYGNATWDDLISILKKYTKSDLYEWNKTWVNEPGRPVFEYQVTYAENKIDRFIIKQNAENGSRNIWPQLFKITLVYPNKTKDLTVNAVAFEQEILTAKGLEKPSYIIFNSDALGYGLFPVDQNVEREMFSLKSPLMRSSIYINSYEAMLAGKSYTPTQLLNLFTSGIGLEKNELNLRLLTNYLTTIYWNFIKPEERERLSKGLENLLWGAIEKETLGNQKKILFKAYQDIYLSSAGQNRMHRIWETQEALPGLRLTEDDFTSLALTLALKANKPVNVLSVQRDRIKNEERKSRITFLIKALSTEVKNRDLFFESLKDLKNRTKEAWVNSALAYLHHPLRQESSIRYLPASLELLQEIQKTGDIFFPQSWLASIFSSYQSQEAHEVVQKFLADHPNYNPKLKAKILQTTDNLRRAKSIVK
ncbi:MAG: aminopeptidase [Pedobacter sp.]|nr:MAG: aminopeptidase [Pedobacter sp.]